MQKIELRAAFDGGWAAHRQAFPIKPRVKQWAVQVDQPWQGKR